MSGQHAAQHRIKAVFHPYGRTAPPPAAGSTLELGAVEIEAMGRGRALEHYVLSRSDGCWLLHSSVQGEPIRLLARVSSERLPDDPSDAGAELLVELWSLRLPGRLAFVARRLDGLLGPERWRLVEAHVHPPLEDRLRAEGHRVRSVDGPMGTREHVLVLQNRTAANASMARRKA